LKDTLKIIPLGGLGEVGRNMMLLEYDHQAIMVDCGIMFPTGDMLGIDLVIPDINYLRSNPDVLKGIFITHGHEDHIGALPYLIEELNVPIYATKLTCAFIEYKLQNARRGKAPKADLNIITEKDTINVGPFQVEPFAVSHSIPNAVGLGIHTPQGLIVHTGEFKFDPSPYSGRKTDKERLQRYSDMGVLLLMSDSTNAEHEGITPSEQTIAESMNEIFDNAKGRVILATFASNIDRVQLMADAIIAHDRKVVFVGRSMVEFSRIARELGYLNIPNKHIVPLDQAERTSDSKVAFICTGTQGEPNSALVRMGNDDHRQIEIKSGDTVVVSASIIPGNEEVVNTNIDNLFRLGADVIYQQLKHVHVSGHANRETLKEMIALVKPKYFMPIQGEYRMLSLHGRLAEEMGIPASNIIVIENGQIVEINRDEVSFGKKFPTDYVFIDGSSVGDVGNVVLRDRHNLSQNGFVSCAIAIKESSGKLVEGPEIISRGFIYIRENEFMLDEAADLVVQSIGRKRRKRKLTSDVLNDTIRRTLSDFFYKTTGRRPMIFPVVLEV